MNKLDPLQQLRLLESAADEFRASDLSPELLQKYKDTTRQYPEGFFLGKLLVKLDELEEEVAFLIDLKRRVGRESLDLLQRECLDRLGFQ